MILKYVDASGKEIVIKGIKSIRQGNTLFEYVMADGLTIEMDKKDIERFWIGDNDT